MYRTLLSTVLALSLLSLTACGGGGDTHESLAKEGYDLTERRIAILETVQDEATATQACEDLKELGVDIRALADRAKALDALSEEEQRALTTRFEDRARSLGERLISEMNRIEGIDPSLSEMINNAMRDINRNGG